MKLETICRGLGLDWDAGWVKNDRPGRLPDGCGTNRRYRQPLSEALFPEWQARRDPSWLYSHPDYFWDSLGCSVFEAERPIRRLKEVGLGGVRSVLDLGAGCGLTSLHLRRVFPRAQILRCETDATLNSIWCRLGHNSGVVSQGGWSGTHDMVVALEFLEHFQAPMDIVQQLDCRFLAMHSNWSAEANGWLTLGHFMEYRFPQGVVRNDRPRVVAAAFNRAMRDAGWTVAHEPQMRSLMRVWRRAA